MSSIAQGGKVWNFDRKAVGVVKPGSSARALLVSMLIWGIAGVGVYLSGQQLPNYDVVQLETFAQEYGATVQEGRNAGYLTLTFVLLIGAVLANAFFLFKVYSGAYRYLVFGFVVGIVGVFVASAMGMANPAEKRPDPFAEWAEKTYGYSSIEKVESSPQTVYEGVNAQGESVKFKVYYDGEFQYLYENVDQLKIVPDQVAEKKIALEKKLSE